MGSEGRVMSRVSVVAVGVWLAMVLATPPATAYQIRGYDPNDRRPVGSDPDIRSSVLTVERRGEHRVLVLVIRAYEQLGDYWVIQARLDARGERRADHLMVLWNADTGGAGCSVWERPRRHPADSGHFRQRGRAARCRIPIHLIGPDEPIRWRLVSESGYVDHNPERAPDRGMYG